MHELVAKNVELLHLVREEERWLKPSDSSSEEEVHLLNQMLTWTPTGLEYEADLCHV